VPRAFRGGAIAARARSAITPLVLPRLRTHPMPATGLLALFDDVASLLDDIALLTRVAARKTAGVIGDDLALNAEQVTGMRADRELPVIWAVAKGALLNKVILVPAALLVSAFVPRAITPLLMAGGLFLCYEGFEKVWEKLRPETPAHRAERAARVQAVADPAVDLVAFEKARVRGADPHRLHPLGRDRGDRPRHHGRGADRPAGGGAGGRRRRGHGAGVRARGGARQARRPRAAAAAAAPAAPATRSARASCAAPLGDEGALGRRHRGHVPGGRRDPGARNAADRHLLHGARRVARTAADGVVGVVAGALTVGVVHLAQALRGRRADPAAAA
jgi:hypothetical protein